MPRQETPNPDHGQVPSRVLPGINLDAGIARVIDWLNERGCETLNSCEGFDGLGPWEPGCGYIMFVNAAALQRARQLLRDAAELAGCLRLSVRIAGLPCQTFSDGATVVAGWGMQWRYEMCPAAPREEDPDFRRTLRAVMRCCREDLNDLNSLLTESWTASTHP